MSFWIPNDADEFLHRSHFRSIAYAPDYWSLDRAPWMYFYIPGFIDEVKALVGSMSFSKFDKLVRPLVPVATQIVPPPLKDSIRNVQDEWDTLPLEQLKYAYNGQNMGFAKAVLSLAVLQILALAKASRLKALSVDPSGVQFAAQGDQGIDDAVDEVREAVDFLRYYADV